MFRAAGLQLAKSISGGRNFNKPTPTKPLNPVPQKKTSNPNPSTSPRNETNSNPSAGPNPRNETATASISIFKKIAREMGSTVNPQAMIINSLFSKESIVFAASIATLGSVGWVALDYQFKKQREEYEDFVWSGIINWALERLGECEKEYKRLVNMMLIVEEAEMEANAVKVSGEPEKVKAKVKSDIKSESAGKAEKKEGVAKGGKQ